MVDVVETNAKPIADIKLGTKTKTETSSAGQSLPFWQPSKPKSSRKSGKSDFCWLRRSLRSEKDYRLRVRPQLCEVEMASPSFEPCQKQTRHNELINHQKPSASPLSLDYIVMYAGIEAHAHFRWCHTGHTESQSWTKFSPIAQSCLKQVRESLPLQWPNQVNWPVDRVLSKQVINPTRVRIWLCRSVAWTCWPIKKPSDDTVQWSWGCRSPMLKGMECVLLMWFPKHIWSEVHGSPTSTAIRRTRAAANRSLAVLRSKLLATASALWHTNER